MGGEAATAIVRIFREGTGEVCGACGVKKDLTLDLVVTDILKHTKRRERILFCGNMACPAKTWSLPAHVDGFVIELE